MPPDSADQGVELNERWTAQAQADAIGTRHTYVIAYSSGDGVEFVEFEGTLSQRQVFMSETLGIDADVNDAWAYAKWSPSKRAWEFAGANGDFKRQLEARQAQVSTSSLPVKRSGKPASDGRHRPSQQPPRVMRRRR